jgi:hypothetical protein
MSTILPHLSHCPPAPRHALAAALCTGAVR